MYYVYMVRCTDGSHYTGMAADIRRRMREHLERGEACAKYTRTHPVCALDALWRAETRTDALRLEALIKTLTKWQKLRLIENPEILEDLFGDRLHGSRFEPISPETLDGLPLPAATDGTDRPE